MSAGNGTSPPKVDWDQIAEEMVGERPCGCSFCLDRHPPDVVEGVRVLGAKYLATGAPTIAEIRNKIVEHTNYTVSYSTLKRFVKECLAKQLASAQKDD